MSSQGGGSKALPALVELLGALDGPGEESGEILTKEELLELLEEPELEVAVLGRGH